MDFGDLTHLCDHLRRKTIIAKGHSMPLESAASAHTVKERSKYQLRAPREHAAGPDGLGQTPEARAT